MLDLTTTARSVLGDDLPLIDDAVTVEQLLAHRSGIGDYFDRITRARSPTTCSPVPVHTLAETEDYVAVLGGFPTKFPPGERFSYCNGGFVVLALVAERARGTPFRELVARNVCKPAGMTDTAFLRSDELPQGAAVGYLQADGLRDERAPPPRARNRGRRCLHRSGRHAEVLGLRFTRAASCRRPGRRR